MLRRNPLKDFAAVALCAANYLAVVAYPGVPFKNAGEMIARTKANPGKLVRSVGLEHKLRSVPTDG